MCFRGTRRIRRSLLYLASRNPPDVAKLTENAKKFSVGGKNYWLVNLNPELLFVTLPTETTILTTESDFAMKEILGRTDQKIVLDPSFKELAGKVFEGDVWNATWNRLQDRVQLVGDQEELNAIRRMKGNATKVKVGGSSLTHLTLFQASSSQDATKIAEYFRTNQIMESDQIRARNMTPAQSESIQKSMRQTIIKSSGDWIEMDATIDLAPFDDLTNLPYLWY